MASLALAFMAMMERAILVGGEAIELGAGVRAP